jgi:uncharacterized protein YgbK (DUF1537 family)
MIQCIVIADDLTGANATGVLLRKERFSTYSIIDPESHITLPDSDCAVCSTDSRSVSKEEAYKKVYETTMRFKSNGIKVYSKRIDSTLRGNLGAELDAMLDALDEKRTAMIVPCFPSSGRIHIGGCLLVNGIPLHKTAAAADPKNPMRTPYCADIIRSQSKYPLDSILLRDMMHGVEFMVEKIRGFSECGVRSIVFDAITQEDIDLIAEAVAASRVPFIAVDPGVFTAALAKRIISMSDIQRPKNKILVVVGSVNQVARTQVNYLLASQDVFNVYMKTAEFLESDEYREKEIERVTREITDNCANYSVCSIVGCGIVPEHRVPFESYVQKNQCSFDELSNMINESIAKIVRHIMESGKEFSGIYTCGGDITVAVCKQINSAGLKLLGEVLPLAAYGAIIGGPHDGLKVITKGGMVGDADAIVSCIRYLTEKLAV